MPRARGTAILGGMEDPSMMAGARPRLRKPLAQHPIAVAVRGCAGGLLLDSVMSMAIFILAGSAVLSGVSTVQRSGALTESQGTAERLARNQMELVLSLPYVEPPATLSPIPAPPGYSVVAEAQEYVAGDTDIEVVSVTVRHGGATVLVLETLRTRD